MKGKLPSFNFFFFVHPPSPLEILRGVEIDQHGHSESSENKFLAIHLYLMI